MYVQGGVEHIVILGGFVFTAGGFHPALSASSFQKHYGHSYIGRCLDRRTQLGVLVLDGLPLLHHVPSYLVSLGLEGIVNLANRVSFSSR